MSAPLPLAQRLLLVKYLTERLDLLRKNELLPQAGQEMPSGSRLPAMFGGRQAGWVTMPQPSRKAAFVSDEAALLAWARKQYPEKVGTAETVTVTPAVLDLLREHLPGAIDSKPQVDPQWVADITAALKGGGSYVTAKGEKLTDVPGITVPDPAPPAPRVDLAEDAASVIAAAWLAGDIPADEFLALPAGEGEAAA